MKSMFCSSLVTETCFSYMVPCLVAIYTEATRADTQEVPGSEKGNKQLHNAQTKITYDLKKHR